MSRKQQNSLKIWGVYQDEAGYIKIKAICINFIKITETLGRT